MCTGCPVVALFRESRPSFAFLSAHGSWKQGMRSDTRMPRQCAKRIARARFGIEGFAAAPISTAIFALVG